MIKFQRLGGGFNIKVIIETSPQALVTISKGDVTKQTTADDSGNALFKNVSAGVWNVVCQKDGSQVTGQITLTDEFTFSFPVGIKLSEMPLQTKIKLGDYKWVLQNRGISYYPTGAQILVSDISVADNFVYSTVNANYETSNFKAKAGEVYNSIQGKDRDAILPTTRTYRNTTNATYSLVEYVFGLNGAETGRMADATIGQKIFNSASEMIKKNASGANVSWWVVGALNNQYCSHVDTSGSTGTYFDYPTSSYSVILGCCLSGDTLLSPQPDSEGYYTIL